MSKYSKNSLFYLILFYLLWAIPVYASDKYRVWVAGTEARKLYESAVLRLALEKSVPKYGPFLLEDEKVGGSVKRVAERIKDEKIPLMMVTTSDPVSSRYLSSLGNISNHKILNGVLGYRKLMVIESNLPKFNALKNGSDLKSLKAGQVENWIDKKIYEINGYNVVSSYSFEALFRMLVHNRFDYLPLGVGEIGQTLKGVKEDYPNITIVPDVYIHYELPLFLYFNKNEKKLKARLELGLKKIIDDGSGQVLFDEFHKKFLKEVKSSSAKLYKLDSSLVEQIKQLVSEY